MELCFQLDKVAKIVRWKVKEGNNIYQGKVIFEYVECANEGEENQPTAALKFKATKSGVISKILATKGSSIQKGTPLLALNPAEQCTHPIVMHDMCGVCSKDLRQLDDPQPNVASVAMVHSVPGLKVSMEEAQILGKADEQHLLKQRKLVLLVDLDQTLIHTTNDTVPHNLEDVFHFQLNSHGPVWYHTRLRPGTHEFLGRMNDLFQLHICTFGTRQYANTIAKHLDPQRKFFSDRILSRDECFHPNSKTANLKELFPRGDHMVCIIDDREDVWSYASNLIHVKPYHFFRHTGDINAPPGLTKKDNDDKDGFEFPNDISKTEAIDESTIVNSSVVPEIDKLVEDTKLVEQISVESEHKVIESFEEAVGLDTPDILEDGDKSASAGMNESILSVQTNSIVSDPSETIVESLLAESDQNSCLNNDKKVEENVVVGVGGKTVEESSCGDDPKIPEQGLQEEANQMDIPSSGGDVIISEMEVQQDSNNSEDPSSKDTVPMDVEENSTEPAIPSNPDEVIISLNVEKPSSTSHSSVTANKTESVEVNANEANKTESSDSMTKDITDPLVEGDELEKDVSQTPSETPTPSECTKEAVPSKAEDVIKIEDPDDYLLYLEEILKSIHKAYYALFDDMGLKGKTGVPDVKAVIPYVRRKVLKGTSIVFSGVIPTRVQLEKSRQYAVAVSLGAHVSTKITPPPKPGSNVKLNEPPTTHVVAAREGTAKVNEARKWYKGIHIVTPDWLWCCAERWDRAEEKMFHLFKKSHFKRNPPAHCSSPEQTLKKKVSDCLTPLDDVSGAPSSSVVAGPSTSQNSNPALRKERTPSGRFMDTINPLLTFSMDEIESMDHEVDDIFNESDSSSSTEEEEGRTKKERLTPRRKKPKLSVPTVQQISGRIEKDSSSNDDDTETENENTGSADTVLGKRKRSPMRTETETEDEPLSTRFRRGEPLPSDLDTLNLLSDSSDDDDGDKVNEEEDNWMAEALEREFLDENSQDTQN